MKHTVFLLFLLVGQLLAREVFEPNRMQLGCPSVQDYERADKAKGYGAGKVFTDSGCIYLGGLNLIFKEKKDNYIKICLKDSEKMCYWTIDTRH